MTSREGFEVFAVRLKKNKFPAEVIQTLCCTEESVCVLPNGSLALIGDVVLQGSLLPASFSATIRKK